MGNDEFSVSESVRSQWGEKVQEGRRIFFNKTTLDSQNRCGVPQLVQRSIYPLPNTPKVIILNDIRGEFSILAQHPHCPLSALLGQLATELQLLQLLQKTVLALRGLFLRFGAFWVSAQMCAADQRGEPMVWINSCFEHNHIQNPLTGSSQPEQKMVAQTAALLRSMLRGGLIYHRMLNESAGSFAAFLHMIEDAIRDERNAINSKKTKWKPVLITPQRALSPRNTFESLNALKIQINYKSKYCANNVPKFIKSFKNRNETSLCKIVSGDIGKNSDKFIKTQARLGKDCSKLATVRSLNGSPEAKEMSSTLMSTANSFNQSQGRLCFSRHLDKTAANMLPMKQLEIPLTYSLSSNEMPGKRLIPEVSEEENSERQLTFDNPSVPFSSGILANYCKGVSQSQELRESMDRVLGEEQNLSLQVNPQLNESVVIHGVQGSDTFNCNYLALYKEIGKVPF